MEIRNGKTKMTHSEQLLFAFPFAAEHGTPTCAPCPPKQGKIIVIAKKMKKSCILGDRF